MSADKKDEFAQKVKDDIVAKLREELLSKPFQRALEPLIGDTSFAATKVMFDSAELAVDVQDLTHSPWVSAGKVRWD